MQVSASKFLDYLEEKKTKLSNEISALIYELNKDFFSTDPENGEEVKKAFKNATRNVLFKQKDEFKAHLDVLDEQKTTDDGINTITYLYALEIVTNFMKLIIENKSALFPPSAVAKYNRLIEQFDRYSDYIASVKICVVMDCYTSLLFPFKDFVQVLENSNINKKNKYDIFLLYVDKLKYDLSSEIYPYLPDNVKVYYSEVKKVYDKFNINFEEMNFTESEIDEFLSLLGVSNEFIEDLKNYLIKSKERKIEKFNDESSKSNIESGINKYIEKEEEHNRLKAKLEEYFDLKDMHLKRFLNREETNIVLSILKELGYGEEVIRKFICDNDTLFSKQDFIARCEYILGRAKFYSSMYGFEKEYNDFEDYYNGYLEAEDKEDKEFYYELLGISYDEIMSFLRSMPKTYEYELEKSKNVSLLLKCEEKNNG